MILRGSAPAILFLGSSLAMSSHQSLWEDQFERLALDPTGHKGWRVVDGQGKLRVRAEAQGGVARFSVAPGLRYAAASPYVPYDFDPKSEAFAEYLQVRVAEEGGASWAVLDGSLGGTVTPSMKAVQFHYANLRNRGYATEGGLGGRAAGLSPRAGQVAHHVQHRGPLLERL